jgi:enoyl-CoA hydratase
MVTAIDRALSEFETSDVATVAIDGAGERGLCAGGDIRAIYDAILSSDPAPRSFWRHEYRLNARIARYPKPIVAIMDGIVMGGGVGISAHAALRVVTERTTVAMPEVGIGFAPDVGSTWLLAQAPGELGTHVGLTGTRLGAADAIACGLAGYYLPTSSLPALFHMLAHGDPYISLAALSESPAPAGRPLSGSRSWIDTCYGYDTVEEIVRRLRGSDHIDAHAAADEIASKSPTSLKVTLRALRAACSSKSIEECLEREYRISTTFLDIADFVEGVRAAVIDKDRNPRWNPERLGLVTDEMVERFFATRQDELLLAKKGPTV